MHTQDPTQTNPQANAQAQSKLIHSVKSTLDHVETLLRDAANASGEQAAELRARAMTSLRQSREALHDAQDAVLEQGRRAVRATDDYVHDNPWQSVGIAGVIGLLLGVLISRR